MIVTLELNKKSGFTGVRPIQLPGDLIELANLLDIAFGPELEMTDSHIVEDLRQAARLRNLLWAAGGARLDGFVYLDEGQLVGNITLSSDPRDSGNWFISNVAVLPEWRGQGIASKLLDTALDYLQTMKARWVRLQVRPENLVAYRLYQRRGFITFDTTEELKLDKRLLSPDIARPDKRLRPMRPRDSRALWQLVVATSAPKLLEHHVLRPADYRRTWLRQLDYWLESWLEGSMRYEIVGSEGRWLAAYAALVADSWRSSCSCEVRVAPGQRGCWEEALVRQLLTELAGRRRRNVLASISITHPEALDALRKIGFIRQRTLAQMGHEM